MLLRLDEMIRPGRLTCRGNARIQFLFQVTNGPPSFQLVSSRDAKAPRFFSEPEADGSPSPAVLSKESDAALLSFQENGWQDDLPFPVDAEDKDCKKLLKAKPFPACM